MTITLPPEIESRLKGQAVRRGLDAAEYASKIIADHLPEDTDDAEEEETRQRGTVPIDVVRETLFTQLLTQKVDELPQWEPQVILTPRDLSESDDV